MLNWIVLIAIILTFSASVIYLYTYIDNSIKKINKTIDIDLFKKRKKPPGVNRREYENAYQRNTNFENNDYRLQTENNKPNTGLKDTVVGKITDENSRGLKREKGGKNMADTDIDMIKAAVVRGENVIEKINISTISLRQKAVALKDTKVYIDAIEAEVIKDKVIIQGILHTDVFYVGEDNRVYHQSKNNYFNYLVDIPGAETGMNVLVEPTFEYINSHITGEGQALRQQVVLQFFVKLLLNKNIMIKTGGGPLIKAERIIGVESKKHVVKTKLPANVSISQVLDNKYNLVACRSEVIEDRVLVRGVILRELFYKGEDQTEHSQEHKINFDMYINVPGARPNMTAELKSRIDYIENGSESSSEAFITDIGVTVIEYAPLNIVTGKDELVMMPEIITENINELNIEITIELENAAVKVEVLKSEIEKLNINLLEDKALVNGLISQRLYYIDEKGVEHYQESKKPFTTLVVLNGAREGMKAEGITEIIYSKQNLTAGCKKLRQTIIIEVFLQITEDIQFNICQAKLEDNDVIKA
ncbi:MAG: DUF3794 domain-containing protein [Halanaerobiales bacterium]